MCKTNSFSKIEELFTLFNKNRVINATLDYLS